MCRSETKQFLWPLVTKRKLSIHDKRKNKCFYSKIGHNMEINFLLDDTLLMTHHQKVYSPSSKSCPFQAYSQFGFFKKRKSRLGYKHFPQLSFCRRHFMFSTVSGPQFLVSFQVPFCRLSPTEKVMSLSSPLPKSSFPDINAL